jgi:hypothetical protein
LRDVAPEIARRGAALAVVGSGSVEQARAFAEEQALTFPLLADPDLRAYAAAGLRRSLASTLRPSVLLHGLRALRHGFRQRRTAGDPWQQGGLFVFAPPDRELFAHVSEEAGDHAAPARFLAALPWPGGVPEAA